MVQVPVASMLICETFWQNQGGTRHRPKLIFDIMKAYKTPFSTMLLFHVSRTFGSHDMVIYTSHLCRCLKNELMRNKSSKKVKLIDSHSDYLFLKLLKNISIPFFITISKNMDSKHIKVDRNQQIKKVSPHSVFYVSYYSTLPNTTWFCPNASHMMMLLHARYSQYKLVQLVNISIVTKITWHGICFTNIYKCL